MFVVTAGLLPGRAAAQKGYEAPFIERGLGATNVEATTGNGRLTAGISREGDLSVLSWPSPSFWDQLHYITSNGPDAREQPRFGAPKRAGAFAGISVTFQGAGEPWVSFFRTWPNEDIQYTASDVRIVETTFRHPDRGLKVVQRDMIPPDHDVLVRRYVVETTDGAADVQKASLLAYTNLSPGMSKVPQLPLLGVIMDHQNDFLGVWRKDRRAFVQFHPGDTGIIDEIARVPAAVNGGVDRDFGRLGALLKSKNPSSSKIQNLAGRLDELYAEGVYAAVSTHPKPAGYQLGEDQTDFCKELGELADNVQDLGGGTLPVNPAAANFLRCGDFQPLKTVREEEAWTYDAEDAYTDLKDGTLNGNALAGAQVNAGLRVPLAGLSSSGKARATQFLAFGSTSQQALDTLEWARNNRTSIRSTVVQHDRQFVEDLWIPKELSGELKKFIQRAFLNVRVGTDRESKAVVASISRQPSYQLDWPRDGAFFNTALDLSGQHELVTERMKFYSETIRDEPKEPAPLINKDSPGWPSQPNRSDYPPDSWEMNYYADGPPGGTIRLEIDNTALLVWAYVAHAGYLEGEARESYIQREWPTIKRAANFVHRWRDPETGLMWPANEDDHSEYTQGLQGAATSYLALTSAARLAEHLGEDQLADDWLHRAGELKNATLKYMYEEGEGFSDYGESGKAAGRAWLGWPTHFLSGDDPRLKSTLKKVLESQLKLVEGKAGNGGYPTKVAISVAITLDDQQLREKAFRVAKKLAEDIAHDETWTIGEAIVPVDEDGDGTTDDFINGVSTPHLWSSILVYLTAVAYHHPEKFDQYREVFPKVEVPDVPPPGEGGGDVGADAGGSAKPPGGGGGCSCRAAGNGTGTPLAWFLGLVAVGRLLRRRGDPRRA
ncbi:MAG: glycoside hydrolase family 15 protein [Bradymonadaceae bacterium]